MQKIFLSDSLVLIGRKAFLTLPLNKIGFNLYLTRLSHCKFWRKEPVSKHSFRENEFLVGFEETSYTIVSFIILADVYMYICIYFAVKVSMKFTIVKKIEYLYINVKEVIDFTL